MTITQKMLIVFFLLDLVLITIGFWIMFGED